MPITIEDIKKALEIISNALDNIKKIIETASLYYSEVVIPFSNLNSYFIRSAVVAYLKTNVDKKLLDAQPQATASLKITLLLQLAILLNPKAEYHGKSYDEILKTKVFVPPNDPCMSYAAALEAHPTIEDIFNLSDSELLQMLNSYKLLTQSDKGRHPLESTMQNFINFMIQQCNLNEMKNKDLDALLFYFWDTKYPCIQMTSEHLLKLINIYKTILQDCGIKLKLYRKMHITDECLSTSPEMTATQQTTETDIPSEVKNFEDRCVALQTAYVTLQQALSKKLPFIFEKQEEATRNSAINDEPTTSRQLNLQTIDDTGMIGSISLIDFFKKFLIPQLLKEISFNDLFKTTQNNPTAQTSLDAFNKIIVAITIHTNALIGLLHECTRCTNQYNTLCGELTKKLAQAETVTESASPSTPRKRSNSAPDSPKPSSDAPSTATPPAANPKLPVLFTAKGASTPPSPAAGKKPPVTPLTLPPAPQ